jgi:glycosyltransferase involved in cell wall biosynthesis
VWRRPVCLLNSKTVADSQSSFKVLNRTVSVGVIAPCPTQYYTPFFQHLARIPGLRLKVLYLTDFGMPNARSTKSEFERPIVWDLDLLDGYAHQFLKSPGGAELERALTVTAPGLIKAITPSAFDVLVIFGWRYPANLLAIALATIHRIPFLYYSDADVRNPGRTPLPLLRRTAITGLCRLAHGALFSGTFNRDSYIRHGMRPEQLWFSPWAVDNARFASVNHDDARRHLGLRDDLVYFLFVGKLIGRKRPDLLLTAVERLTSEGHAVGALFAGSGALQTQLENQMVRAGLSDVEFLGFVNQTELPWVYAAADVFVLPSTTDPRGAVINEAMASGLPVVISEGTGSWGFGDLVIHGENGFVFPRDQLDELVDACRKLLSSDTRSRLAAAARSRVAIWSYDTAAAGWLAAIEHCVRRCQPGT